MVSLMLCPGARSMVLLGLLMSGFIPGPVFSNRPTFMALLSLLVSISSFEPPPSTTVAGPEGAGVGPGVGDGPEVGEGVGEGSGAGVGLGSWKGGFPL